MSNVNSQKPATDQNHESYADDAKARRMVQVDGSGTVLYIANAFQVGTYATIGTSGTVNLGFQTPISGTMIHLYLQAKSSQGAILTLWESAATSVGVSIPAFNRDRSSTIGTSLIDLNGGTGNVSKAANVSAGTAIYIEHFGTEGALMNHNNMTKRFILRPNQKYVAEMKSENVSNTCDLQLEWYEVI